MAVLQSTDKSVKKRKHLKFCFFDFEVAVCSCVYLFNPSLIHLFPSLNPGYHYE